MALFSVKLIVSLYAHNSRIYPYTVNVYKIIFSAMLERQKNENFHMCEYLIQTAIYIYIYILRCESLTK